MTTAGKVIIGVGVLGAVTGIGYAVVRYIKRRRADHGSKSEPESEHKSEIADRPAEVIDPPKTEPASPVDPVGVIDPPKIEPAPPVEPAEVIDSPRIEPAPPVEPASTPGAVIDEPTRVLAPLPEPTGPLARKYINSSTTDDDKTVEQSADELLAQARRFDPSITLDELTGARLAVSEHGSGTFTELACIVDAELNRAERRGLSLFKSLTYKGTFGRQGKKRRASTRQDPTMRHLWAARAVLSGKARGISQGAVQFFDPVAMDKMYDRYRQWVDGGRKGKQPAIVSCDALGLLEAWSFDYGKTGKSRCPPDKRKRGRYTLAWVGEIPGVDPLRLMLMKRMKPNQDHAIRYNAARAVLEKGLGKS